MFLLLITVLTTTGPADTVVLKNQKVFKGAWVVSFNNDPQQGAMLLAHTAEEKKLSDTLYALTTDKIALIKFNWIGDDGYSTENRKGNLTLKNGTSYLDITISKAEASNNSFGFYIRSGGSQDPSEFLFVSENSIQSLVFLPANPPIEMHFNAELRDFYMRQGEHHWSLDALEKRQLNKLSPEEVENIPGMTKEIMEKLVENILEGNASYAWDGLTRREYKKRNGLADDEDEEEEEEEEEERAVVRDMSIDDQLGLLAKQLEEQRMTGGNLQKLMDQIDTRDLAGDGYGDEGDGAISKSVFKTLAGVGFLLLLLSAVLYLIPSILILKFICFVENIKDVSWKNLAICAAGLAIVPPIVTFLSYNYLLWIIPVYGGVFALLVYLFLSRNIVMGSMEVFEGQAWVIVIVDLLIRIGLVIFFSTKF
jgi:hypothetical protein